MSAYPCATPLNYISPAGLVNFEVDKLTVPYHTQAVWNCIKTQWNSDKQWVISVAYGRNTVRPTSNTTLGFCLKISAWIIDLAFKALLASSKQFFQRGEKEGQVMEKKKTHWSLEKKDKLELVSSACMPIYKGQYKMHDTFNRKKWQQIDW